MDFLCLRSTNIWPYDKEIICFVSLTSLQKNTSCLPFPSNTARHLSHSIFMGIFNGLLLKVCKSTLELDFVQLGVQFYNRIKPRKQKSTQNKSCIRHKANNDIRYIVTNFTKSLDTTTSLSGQIIAHSMQLVLKV